MKLQQPKAQPLFLDDIRDPKDGYLHDDNVHLCYKAQVPAGCWQVVRTFDQFVFWIKKHGVPIKVSFDNDLCPDHYQLYVTALKTGQPLDWQNIQPRMGLFALNWLINHCKAKNIVLPEIYFHTANCVARKQMGKMVKKELDKLKLNAII